LEEDHDHRNPTVADRVPRTDGDGAGDPTTRSGSYTL
jgi:hypothetical protein